MDHTQCGTDEKKNDDGRKGNILPVCSICNQVPDLGIKGVIRMGKAWICLACEQEIIHLEVGSPGYGLMIEKIRRVWK